MVFKDQVDEIVFFIVYVVISIIFFYFSFLEASGAGLSVWNLFIWIIWILPEIRSCLDVFVLPPAYNSRGRGFFIQAALMLITTPIFLILLWLLAEMEPTTLGTDYILFVLIILGDARYAINILNSPSDPFIVKSK